MTTSRYEDPLSLADYLRLFARRWRWLAFSIAFSLCISGYFVSKRDPVYVAEARVSVAQSTSQRAIDPGSQNTGYLSRAVSNEVALATSDLVIDDVVALLGDEPTVTIDQGTAADVLVFRASASTADDAALHANTWARAYISAREQDSVSGNSAASVFLLRRLEDLSARRLAVRAPLEALDRQISQTVDPDERAGLRTEYERVTLRAAYQLDLLQAQARAATISLTDLATRAEFDSAGHPQVIERADKPRQANSTAVSHLVIASLFGLLTAVAVVTAISRHDLSIASAGQAAELAGLPLLGVLAYGRSQNPKEIATLVWSEPDGTSVSDIHKLRSVVDSRLAERSGGSVLVTSVGPVEGRSAVASNLALSFTLTGTKTVLVDLDLREGRLHETFELQAGPGFGESFRTPSKPDVQLVEAPGAGTLEVVTRGSDTDGLSLMNDPSNLMVAMRAAAATSTISIFDSPPIHTVAPTHVAKSVDAVILTIKLGQTSRSELVDSVAALRKSHVELLGIVAIRGGSKCARIFRKPNPSLVENTKPSSAFRAVGGDIIDLRNS